MGTNRYCNIVVLVVMLALSGLTPSCCPGKHLSHEHNSSHKDSTAINWVDSLRIKDSLAIHYIDVPVPIPSEGSNSLLPQNRRSHIETSIAESDAWVDSTGLHHTLSNKKGTLTATVPVTEHYHSVEHTTQKDSTNVSEHHESEKETIEVEREFTKWEKFRLLGFWFLAFELLACLAWIFRGPILKLIKRIGL